MPTLQVAALWLQGVTLSEEALSSGVATGSSAASAIGSSLAEATGIAAGTSTASGGVGTIPVLIVITGETWATPQADEQAWYAATVTSETWSAGPPQGHWAASTITNETSFRPEAA
jgi:hypothetical protein